MAAETVEAADDILARARQSYDRALEYWADNHKHAKDDLEFARLEMQWPDKVKHQRELENRPCETFNKMPSFIRQVVNDARQNKPSIKVHPADSGADVKTAEIIDGLIRNIEVISDADVAYDTAIESAVDKGFGYFRINTKYTCDDAFDQDIVVERIANAFTVLGDPRSEAADSSDWNDAWIITRMSKEEFKREYPKAEKVDWDLDFQFSGAEKWFAGEDVVVGEWWTREKVKAEIVALDDGRVVKVEDLEKQPENYKGASVIGEPREVESYKVTQRIMSGAEELKRVEWAGRYIPIVPVYGDEVIDEDGKRHFRSLIRDAKGAQRMFNYMRNTSIEMVALAPRVPFLVEVDDKGSMGIPAEEEAKYDTANSHSHSYLAYRRGGQAPQRQPYAGVPAGVIQETLSAADDMKSIIGIYDASLGAKSNETSGRAIMARQREGDVSTFHFIDNLSRAIRHAGRILIDLIPKVYSTARIVRVLGEDMKPSTVAVNQPVDGQGQPVQQGAEQIAAGVFDLTAGKYDLTVKTGPAYTSRREEARMELVEVMQAYPDATPVLGPMYLRNSDWPGAEEAADKLEQQQQGPQVPPEVQQQIEHGAQMIQRLQQENEQLKASDQAGQIRLKEIDAQIKQTEQETAKIKALAEVEKANIALQQAQIPPPPPKEQQAV